MLVLSRKKNESIVINNDITIVVVEIRGAWASKPRKKCPSTVAKCTTQSSGTSRHPSREILPPRLTANLFPLRLDLLTPYPHPPLHLK